MSNDQMLKAYKEASDKENALKNRIELLKSELVERNIKRMQAQEEYDEAAEVLECRKQLLQKTIDDLTAAIEELNKASFP